VREPIGVVGLITPWNWPINQIVCKVAPALAAGCTMVLKPSEVAPLNAIIWSEIMHTAGVPKGVYNMVQGEGGVVGEAMSAHPGIDMMTIAREEIFGPVLTVLPYRDEAEVIQMANDTVYGLAAYVQSSSLDHARKVASQMRAGNVHLNYPAGDNAAPFGGYKQSGNGREYGKWGLEEFLEVKAVIGYEAA
jgi:acyl-CoA reductase-like NAD-dependent aldehyde dehydrogenase